MTYFLWLKAKANSANNELSIEIDNYIVNVFSTDPPKISPFIFSSELTEGSSVQVLCGVSTGDKPMYFSWFKDGVPISTTLQVIKK